MLEIVLFAVGFCICTIVIQMLLYRLRKNQNKGVSSIWTGYGAIVVICIIGLVTKNINYFAAVLGFIIGDEVGKTARWH